MANSVKNKAKLGRKRLAAKMTNPPVQENTELEKALEPKEDDLLEEAMTLKELLELQEAVQNQIAEQRAKLQHELQALARAGVDLFGRGGPRTRPEAAGGRQRKRKSRGYYVNPKDPSQRWSGMGRRPWWIQERIDRGEDIEKLREKD